MSSSTATIPPPPGTVVTRSKVIQFAAVMLALAAITIAVSPEALREIGSSAFLPHAACYLRESRLIWFSLTSTNQALRQSPLFVSGPQYCGMRNAGKRDSWTRSRQPRLL
jgi:hypothetical protein